MFCLDQNAIFIDTALSSSITCAIYRGCLDSSKSASYEQITRVDDGKGTLKTLSLPIRIVICLSKIEVETKPAYAGIGALFMLEWFRAPVLRHRVQAAMNKGGSPAMPLPEPYSCIALDKLGIGL